MSPYYDNIYTYPWYLQEAASPTDDGQGEIHDEGHVQVRPQIESATWHSRVQLLQIIRGGTLIVLALNFLQIKNPITSTHTYIHTYIHICAESTRLMTLRM